MCEIVLSVVGSVPVDMKGGYWRRTEYEAMILTKL